MKLISLRWFLAAWLLYGLACILPAVRYNACVPDGDSLAYTQFQQSGFACLLEVGGFVVRDFQHLDDLPMALLWLSVLVCNFAMFSSPVLLYCLWTGRRGLRVLAWTSLLFIAVAGLCLLGLVRHGHADVGSLAWMCSFIALAVALFGRAGTTAAADLSPRSNEPLIAE